jgi:hypothetical protein
MRDCMWLLVVLGMAATIGIDRWWHSRIEKDNIRLIKGQEDVLRSDDFHLMEIDRLKATIDSLQQKITALQADQK